MERFLLLLLILSTWAVIITVGRFIPWTSALILLFLIMISYMTVVSMAMAYQKRKERKKPTPQNTDYLPKVSVLLPAHNEEAVIARTVEVLMNLDYPNYELLVIDDRSEDGTAQKLIELNKQYNSGANSDHKYRYLIRQSSATPGKSAVLNEALTLTDGDVVAVFDADAKVAPDFLRAIMPFLADDCVGGAQARKVMFNADQNLLTRCQNYEYSMDSYFQCGRDTIRGAVEFRGNGQLVKRKALESVGGWNEQTLTDDLDLSTRFHIAGWDIRFAHKVLVFEEAIPKFPALLRQRRRWAEGSLTRYLEYAYGVLTSDKASLLAKADLVAYIIEFLFPLWLISDFLYLGILELVGEAHQWHVLSSLMLLPFLSVFFYSMLFIAIVRFNRTGLWRAPIRAFMTSIYLTAVWVPVSSWVMTKMLLQKERSMHWGKTEHFGT